jgi:hypothetical protein
MCIDISGIVFTALCISVKMCHDSIIVDIISEKLGQKRQPQDFPFPKKDSHKTIFLATLDND